MKLDPTKMKDWQIAEAAEQSMKSISQLADEIKLMPGTSSNPAFRRIDVDLKTGKVTGMF